jgi:hypothetical protein
VPEFHPPAPSSEPTAAPPADRPARSRLTPEMVRLTLSKRGGRFLTPGPSRSGTRTGRAVMRRAG